MKSRKVIFLKSVLVLCIVIILGIFIYVRAEKEKTSFESVTGKIIFLDKSIATFPNKDTTKYRYIQLDIYPKAFEVFIGKEEGDFKPKFEAIDKLKMNDIITIYFDENLYTQNDQINRLSYFIDRDRETIFIKGGKEKYIALFIIGVSLLLILMLIVLKQKGKIE